MNYYYHDTPGRLRVKSPKLKGNSTNCRMLEDFLAQKSGILSVSTNPVTGSVVVNYDPGLVSSKMIMDVLSHEGYFNLNQAQTSEQYINDSTKKLGQYVGKTVLNLCLEKAIEGSALSLITAFL